MSIFGEYSIRKCDACGKPFTQSQWDVRHQGHVEGCPQNDFDPCDCDLVYHAACCPICKQERERRAKQQVNHLAY